MQMLGMLGVRNLLCTLQVFEYKGNLTFQNINKSGRNFFFSLAYAQIQRHNQQHALTQKTANRLLWISKGQVYRNRQKADNINIIKLGILHLNNSLHNGGLQKTQTGVYLSINVLIFCTLTQIHTKQMIVYEHAK